MKRLLKYAKPYTFIILLGLFVKILGSIADLMIPKLMTFIIKNIVPLNQVKLIVIWGLAMVGSAVICVILNVTANRMAARVSSKIAKHIRSDLFRKTMTLSAAQTDKFSIPSLESRLTTDTYNFHHFINSAQRLGVRAPILLFGGLIMTLTLDPALTLVMLMIIPFIGLTVFLVSRKGIPLYVKVNKKIDRMIGIVREDVQGIRVIKALSKGDYEKRRYDKANKELSDIERHAGTTMAISNPVMSFLMNIGLTAVILAGAIRVENELTDVANILAFIQYFNMISMAMMSITRMFI